MHYCRELYIHTWIVDSRNCIKDTHKSFMDIYDYTQLQIHMAIYY